MLIVSTFLHIFQGSVELEIPWGAEDEFSIEWKAAPGGGVRIGPKTQNAGLQPYIGKVLTKMGGVDVVDSITTADFAFMPGTVIVEVRDPTATGAPDAAQPREQPVSALVQSASPVEQPVSALVQAAHLHPVVVPKFSKFRTNPKSKTIRSNPKTIISISCVCHSPSGVHARGVPSTDSVGCGRSLQHHMVGCPRLPRRTDSSGHAQSRFAATYW